MRDWIARDGSPPNTTPGDPVTRVTIAFDQGRPLRRREAYPAYQTGREADPKFVGNEGLILRAIAAFSEIAATALPVDVLRGTNTEADDLRTHVNPLDAKSGASSCRPCPISNSG